MGQTAGKPSTRWWQSAVIYQIAPISFQDSNGDGKGDLPGLLSRLEYLAWLGVDAVWVTPIYPSPFDDFGYDISDFCAVDRAFGSMDDFIRLRDALHSRHIRLLLDFVPNHTSDQHRWFVESRASRDNARADWYLWADPSEIGGPPNNWLSRFGGSAWEWSPDREQFYYHSFLAEQPDLNWRNPEVRSAMADVLRFWLDKGVDGFRVDASAVLIKDVLLRDNPVDTKSSEKTPPPQHLVPVFTDDRPETMHCIEFLRSVIDEYEDKVLCGEVQGKTDRIGHFYHGGKDRLHLPLNFALLDAEWDAFSLQAAIDAYFNALPEGAWPDWVIGGHDKQRIASVKGEAQARLMATLCMTLKGTPIFFAGDEIGAKRVNIPENKVRDPFEKHVKGFGLGRDPERAPMRWDRSKNGGFTDGEPWLPLGGDGHPDVEGQRLNKRSILHLYRELISLRRKEPALVSGGHVPARCRNDVLSYRRKLDQTEILVGINVSAEPRKFVWQGEGILLLTTELDKFSEPVIGPTQLRAHEGIILKLH